MAAAPPDTETQQAMEARRQAQCAQRWIAELTSSEKAQTAYINRCKKIVARYKRERNDNGRNRGYAMLWSNTQTVQPAVYARPPEPIVSRRFKDADPVARVASEILERCLSYSIDKQDLDGTLRTCSFDYVLIARGQTWERYVPTKGPMVVPEIELQVITSGEEDADPSYQDEDGNPYEGDVEERDGKVYGKGEPYEPVVFEESVTDYVNWQDFGTSIARTWDEVKNGGFVWRRVYLNRKALIARFGKEKGEKIPLDWGPADKNKGVEDPAKAERKAAIYEIWDSSTKKVFWISKSISEWPCDERDDPLGLDGFFPCPRPLLGTTSTDSLIPVPDYAFWQDQDEEINELTDRIGVLEKALKVRGFYAATEKTNLATLFESSTSTMIPVVDWRGLKEDGGIAGKIEWFPIDSVVQALNACIELRTKLIDDVYQITGVSDILRGMNDPRATATAEALKGQWGTLRVRDRQIEMMRFARDIMRIKGEVIAEKFSADTLKAMSGVKLATNAEKEQYQAQIAQAQQQYQQAAQMAQMQGQQPPPPPQMPPELEELLRKPSWEDVEALLQNNAMRQFRVDIETDSTIEPDQAAEKQAIVELTTAIGGFIAQWGPAVAQQPELAPVAGALIKTAVRRFRAGRELEDVIDTAIDKITSAGPPAAQQPEPVDKTPVEVAQINQQTALAEQAAETQREQMRTQLAQEELQIDRAEAGAKIYALQRDPNPQGMA